jgi:hypothetical protein
VEVQVVTTAIAPEFQRKDPPQETLQQQDEQLLPPQSKRQKSTAAKQMAVFASESGSIFVACQASEKNSKSHLSAASWEEDQTSYGTISKAKKPDQSDKFKIRKLGFCPFTKVVEGFGSERHVDLGVPGTSCHERAPTWRTGCERIICARINH